MPEEPSKPQSWWQTLPGVLTALATIITAITGLIVALIQAGVFPQKGNSAASTPSPAAISSAVETAKPSSAPASSQTGPGNDVDQLEKKLKGVNIMLSTGDAADRKRVRDYFTDPDASYQILAVSCLQVMGDRRLTKSGYLDMIDKHYTTLVGENHYKNAEGKLNLEKLKEAIVKAQNEYNGDNATTFDQVVESR